MGFRFRKRIRIVKGLYLNLGKAKRLAVIPPGEAETHPEANPLALIRQLRSPARASRWSRRATPNFFYSRRIERGYILQIWS